MRYLIAILAGLGIGVVFLEALLAAADFWLLNAHVRELLASGQALPASVSMVVILGWMSGGLVAGLVASGLAGRRAAGWITGLLLGLPALLVGGLAGFGAGGMLALPAAPVLAAIIGAELITRLSDQGQGRQHQPPGPERAGI